MRERMIFRYVCVPLFAVVLFVAGCSGGGGGTDSSRNNQGGNTPSGTEGNPNGNQTGEGNQPATPTPEPTDPVQAKLDSLSTIEKIGQLFIVGMDGTTSNDSIRELLQQQHVGGVIFYKNNIENTKQALSLFNQLKEENRDNPVPLFLSVDEEGGRVSRMPAEYTKLPAAAKIGAVGDAKAAEELGDIIGTELAGFGLNMDFAPVLDVNSNPDNPVIGDRSYSSSASTVSRMGLSEIKGLSGQGVIPVVKHFPGHGDTSVDSHLGLPVVKHDMERLRKLELVPFQAAIEADADAVMVAHLLMPNLDPDHPASFSKAVIQDLLRDELGFGGVVISDDMTMGAISEHYKIEDAAVQFILAGGNIVLIGHELEKEKAAIQAITDAVEQGTIPMNVLDDRVYKVLELKEKYKLSDDPAKGPDIKQVNKHIQQFLSEYKLK
ncbi:beta-N-acetylhexosaminidase [Paenibacillus motobuensis]|uniref:beta-N-acetylhexosaminidase n=1 Tax=Paenibacillus TaxID=44249 RepID=UPI00203BB116|nr:MULTISPECIES: beta-N-acetylhexosaminidase [Paenibacillus]MCM3041833.1 beta-N-acetylhexosaminidase [Paenibacillus lutimineralis]MCM3648937.1 beta-N-acetylhexosaminidase [Paenibacillus motobuensis]